MSIKVVSIILAGGHSSRMGTDKALLPIEGIPLLTRTCQIAMANISLTYIITPWIDRYQDLLPEGCILVREAVVEGEYRSNSPLIGFSQALTYLEMQNIATEWILLLAYDLPCLNAKELRRWIQLLGQTKTETMAFLPRNPKGWEALCGFYRPSCLQSLKRYINQGRRSFQGWLTESVVEELVVSDDRVLFNCNTPQEFETISKIRS
jgi:molybdenum cofactor guanylyltransferase